MHPTFRLRFEACRPYLFGALLIGAVGLIRGAESSADTAEAKDHFVFIGLALTMQGDAGEERIRSVARGSAEVIENGRTSTVPLSVLRNLKTGREPVVSATSVTIDRNTGNRVYSPANDPARQAIQDQVTMDSLQAQQNDRLEQAQIQALNAEAAASRATDPLTRGQLAQEARRAGVRADAASQSAFVNRDFGQKAQMNRAGQDMGPFDAFEVTFVIASEETIDDAYAVLLTTVRDPQNPKVPVDFVALRKLPTIDNSPKKVHLLQAGLPAGFGVDDYEIHIYSGGREIASNLSEKRIEVTRSEAFQFLLLQYTIAHPGETLAPALVPEFLPASLPARISAEQLHRQVDVRVDPQGIVVGVTLESGGDPAADAAIEAVVRAAPFFPALVAGKPAEGSVMLSLRDFMR